MNSELKILKPEQCLPSCSVLCQVFGEQTDPEFFASLYLEESKTTEIF